MNAQKIKNYEMFEIDENERYEEVVAGNVVRRAVAEPAVKPKHQRAPLKRVAEAFYRGDPYEIRTRVTAVKGRCLNRLTKGPYITLISGVLFGSGGQIRTNDLPGMNRPL